MSRDLKPPGRWSQSAESILEKSESDQEPFEGGWRLSVAAAASAELEEREDEVMVRLDDALAGARRLVVDLSGVRVLSSSAVASFLWAHRTCRARGGSVSSEAPIGAWSISCSGPGSGG
jgi:hypothetical protein